MTSGPPGLETRLDEPQGRGEGKPRTGDDHHIHKHLVSLIGINGNGHPVADSRLGAVQLADDNADKRVAQSEPHPAQDEWHRTWQCDGAEELHARRAERSSYLE